MSFSQFCDKFFSQLTPPQSEYIWHVDNVISSMPHIRHFEFGMVPRGKGLTTIKCAHAAWILENDPSTNILVVTQNTQLSIQFKRNVCYSFGGNSYSADTRITAATVMELKAGYRKGSKYDFFFSESVNFGDIRHELYSLRKRKI